MLAAPAPALAAEPTPDAPDFRREFDRIKEQIYRWRESNRQRIAAHQQWAVEQAEVARAARVRQAEAARAAHARQAEEARVEREKARAEREEARAARAKRMEDDHARTERLHDRWMQGLLLLTSLWSVAVVVFSIVVYRDRRDDAGGSGRKAKRAGGRGRRAAKAAARAPA